MQLAIRAVWAVGAVSRLTGLRFGFIVNVRDQNTLLPLLHRGIRSRSFFCTDYWGAYSNLNQIFAGHGRVNHSTNFVYPPRHQPPIWVPAGTFFTKCLDDLNIFPPPIPNMEPVRFHIQKAENSWKSLKKILRKCRTVRDANSYLGEWMYRQNILGDYLTMTDKFQRFLTDCRRTHPGVGLNP